MLSYIDARKKVIEVAGSIRRQPLLRESIEIEQGFGRVLAREVRADRDYPPFNRSTRDGFAVRAADVSAPGARLECIGEIRAGGAFDGALGPGQCIEIMTGASVPAGADAVAMIEHSKRDGRTVTLDRAVRSGDHIVSRGSEARAGALLVAAGTRLGYAEIALAAQAGATRLEVFSCPCLAILSTGDEVVDARTAPGPIQVRNSNGISIEVLARTAGALPIQLGNAPDEKTALRRDIERGLEAGDILVLSGGVSMGKYDLVEQVLSELGAEFHFTGVAIRPGRPAVFATCHGKLVFGLPGNPVSSMVTFELFVLPAIDRWSGAAPRPLPVFRAKLVAPIRESGTMFHFLPARIEWEGREARATQLPWQGSGDIVSLALANGFLVVGPERTEVAAGDWVDVMPRRGAL
jgi:molybdopterin molybdotransferase